MLLSGAEDTLACAWLLPELLDVEADGGRRLKVSLSASSRPDVTALAVGEEVWLSWESSALWLLPS